MSEGRPIRFASFFYFFCFAVFTSVARLVKTAKQLFCCSLFFFSQSNHIAMLKPDAFSTMPCRGGSKATSRKESFVWKSVLKLKKQGGGSSLGATPVGAWCAPEGKPCLNPPLKPDAFHRSSAIAKQPHRFAWKSVGRWHRSNWTLYLAKKIFWNGVRLIFTFAS